jgi:hypothetical protein
MADWIKQLKLILSSERIERKYDSNRKESFRILLLKLRGESDPKTIFKLLFLLLKLSQTVEICDFHIEKIVQKAIFKVIFSNDFSFGLFMLFNWNVKLKSDKFVHFLLKNTIKMTSSSPIKALVKAYF